MAKINCPACHQMTSSMETSCSHCGGALHTTPTVQRRGERDPRKIYAMSGVLAFVIVAITGFFTFSTIKEKKRQHMQRKTPTIRITREQYDYLIALRYDDKKALAQDIIDAKGMDCQVRKLVPKEHGTFTVWKVRCRNHQSVNLKIKL